MTELKMKSSYRLVNPDIMFSENIKMCSQSDCKKTPYYVNIWDGDRIYLCKKHAFRELKYDLKQGFSVKFTNRLDEGLSDE